MPAPFPNWMVVLRVNQQQLQGEIGFPVYICSVQVGMLAPLLGHTREHLHGSLNCTHSEY